MTALNLGIQESGNPGIWDPKIQKFQIIKIKIRVAQNVGKVWISRKKQFLAPLGPFQSNFCMDRKNPKHDGILHIFLGGPMGPYSPGLGASSYICLGWYHGRYLLELSLGSGPAGTQGQIA